MFLYLLGLLVLYYVYRWVKELPRVSNKGNKYVYVTGCDSGFGNLLARHLDKKGFRVVAGCFTEKGEEELRKSCSDNLITTHLDVRSKESVAKVAAMIKDKVGECGECGGSSDAWHASLRSCLSLKRQVPTRSSLDLLHPAAFHSEIPQVYGPW